MDNGNSSKIDNKRVVGEGFFTASGRLKSKEELRQNVEKTSTEQASSSSISNALSKVDQRFRSDVSAAANDLNRKESQIKQVKTDLKAEKKALNSLKEAFESDDQQQIEKAQAELEEVRGVRAERQNQIENEQRVSGSTRRVSIGNKEQASINLPEIKLGRIETSTPVSKKEAKEQLEAVKAEVDNMKSLKEPLKEARSQLSKAYDAGQKELEQVRQSSVNSITGAQQLASKIVDEAQGLTSSELISSAFGKARTAAASLSLMF